MAIPGTCHFNHPKNEYDQALWHQSITTANETSGTFSTSQSTLAGGEPFRLPALDAACNGREQVFEVRYMRGGEVLGRTVVQAIGMCYNLRSLLHVSMCIYSI